MHLPLKNKPTDDALASIRAGRAAVQLTDDSPEEALDLYRFTNDPRKRAAIYASVIGPEIQKRGYLPGWEGLARRGNKMLDLDIPVSAANSVGTLTGNIVAQRVLELMRIKYPLLTRITTDLSTDQCRLGQTIFTRYLAIPLTGDYSPTVSGYAGTTVPPISQTSTDVQLALNGHKFTTAQFTANDLSGTARRLFEEFAPAMATALAKALVDALYALILEATFTNTTTLPSVESFGQDTLIDCATTLDLRSVPMGAEERTALLYPTYFGAAAKSVGCVTVVNEEPARPRRGGTIPDCGGFYCVSSPGLPNTGNLRGFCFSKSALVLATRLPADYTQILPGAAWGNVQTVIDQDTGLALLSTAYADHNLGACNLRLALLFGVSSGQVAVAQVLKTD